MVKHPIRLPLLKAADSSRSRDHDRRMRSEICAVKEMSAVKLNQISEKTRSKFLLLVIGLTLSNLQLCFSLILLHLLRNSFAERWRKFVALISNRKSR